MRSRTFFRPKLPSVASGKKPQAEKPTLPNPPLSKAQRLLYGGVPLQEALRKNPKEKMF
jgi:hypothetical protein